MLSSADIVRAVVNKDYATIGRCTAATCNVNAPRIPALWDRSVLQYAASKGDFKAVKLLLCAGADPAFRSGDDCPALALAIQATGVPAQARLTMVNILLEHGAQVNQLGSREATPLDFAIDQLKGAGTPLERTVFLDMAARLIRDGGIATRAASWAWLAHRVSGGRDRVPTR